MVFNNLIQVQPISAYDDNYIWLLSDSYCAVVVDPGDAEPVIAYLKERHLKLKAILVTHHHADHIGGIQGLLNWAREIGEDLPVIYGPAGEDIALPMEGVMQGDSLHIAQPACDLFVLDVPGHTSGHIAFLLTGAEHHLFCGDVLFASGCGRIFEGTPEQMFNSLGKLKQLHPETLIHCAHEYTLGNIKFALTVEPHNQELLSWKDRAQALRHAGKPTLPTTLAHELEVNPFLRCEMLPVVSAVTQHAKLTNKEPLTVFTALRVWKDGFK